MIGTAAGGFHSTNSGPARGRQPVAQLGPPGLDDEALEPACRRRAAWRLEMPPAKSAPASGRRSFHRPMRSVRV